MLLEHERNYGSGMDALVDVCSWNTNGIVVRAWMLWSTYALGTRPESWFGHGCSGRRMLLEHERNYGLGMDDLVAVCSWSTNGIMVWAWMLWSTYALGARTELWFGHGCSGRRMLLEHERKYGLGMDALVAVCSWSTNAIMVWAWMLWSPYVLGTRTELKSGSSLQESAPGLKVLGAKLGHGQLHCTDAGRATARAAPKKPRNAGLRNVSDMCVSAARPLVGGLNHKLLKT